MLLSRLYLGHNIFHFRVHGDDDGLTEKEKQIDKLTTIPHLIRHFYTYKWRPGWFPHENIKIRWECPGLMCVLHSRVHGHDDGMITDER